MFRRAVATLGALTYGLIGGTAAQADPHRILIYGDSNTWGYEGRSDDGLTSRFPADRRWTGIVQRSLGSNYVVIEDGLNLRTTNLDGEDWPGSVMRPDTVNGAKHLPASIAANMPLDLVVIMLGTNDLQARYKRTPRQIADAVVGLARLVQASSGGIGTVYRAPKVLIVSPVQVSAIPIDEWNRRYAGSREKSIAFSAAFKDAADTAAILEFDAAAAIGGAAHGVDGIHLSETDHRKLAAAILPTIQQVIGTP
ncbi:GDSL-type esterase/lipase family protein [Sphingomonas sp. 1185]|uniref:GDSL-type esterase/lipase family protein n=1 Tax=Sphingomonas sp. 1185 TaxID=3156411 RepID=UPI00339458C9